MVVVTLPDGSVRVDFIASDGTNSLSDCLFLSADEYAAATGADLEAMQQGRLAAWVAFISQTGA